MNRFARSARRPTAAALLAVLGGCAGTTGSAVAPSQALPLATLQTASPQCKPLTVPRHAFSISVNGLNDRRDVVELATVHHRTASYEVYWPFRRNRYREIGIGLGTVATSINDAGLIAGWYLSDHGATLGFILSHGVWTSYEARKPHRSHTNVTELLGLNDDDSLVGFYLDGSGADRAFELNAATGKSYEIRPPGAVSAEATAINNRGDVTGFLTQKNGSIESFLLKGGSYTLLQYPGGGATQAFGVGRSDEIVGSYVDTTGKTHGFILTDPLASPQWQSFDYPESTGPTVLKGVNERGDLIGSYVDAYQRSHSFYCH
ncbi:MAG TPA: hypothetical protein VHT92_11285 [Candidatus Cybelea sp.]|jgi:hypothetical protein|nr:hypothetical protein [Candidatus Cybelea sp.]